MAPTGPEPGAPQRCKLAGIKPARLKRNRLKQHNLKHDRLKRRAEFLAVAGNGRKTAMPGLVLQMLPRDDAMPARLGFTVTKKVGNAVVRNRTRRRLREAARLLLRDLQAGQAPVTGVDLVLVGRDKTRQRPFALLIDDLRQALARSGLPKAAP